MTVQKEGRSSDRLVRNALMMMAGIFTSRILGLVREIITAALFGASRALDAFFVAFTLSNLARQLLAEGALSAAFVPAFSQVLERDGRASALSLARQAMTILLVASVVVTGLGVWASPVLVRFMAPGFDAAKMAEAVSLTRLMFPFLLLISLAALFMGVLNSLNSFFAPALAPALSNLIYIVLALVLAPLWGVVGLAWAVLAGGLIQALFQWYWAWSQQGMLLVPQRPDRHNSDLKRMMALFLPYAAGLSLNQLMPVLSRVFGSFLADGAISVLNYSNRIIQLPLGLVVIAISQAVLPELSRSDSDERFAQIMRDAMRLALFLVVPITVGTLLLSSEMVHVLFFRGAFGETAWLGTSSALFYSVLGLPGMACGTVVMRGLYARQMPRAAMAVTLTSAAGLLVFGAILLRPMGMEGVALATSLAFTLSSVVGYWCLRRRGSVSLDVFAPRWCFPLFLSSLIMATALWCLRTLWAFPQTASLSMRGLWLLAAVICGAVVFGLVSFAGRCDEWDMVRSALRRNRTRTEEGSHK